MQLELDLSKILDNEIHLKIKIMNVFLQIGLCSYSSAYIDICKDGIRLCCVAESFPIPCRCEEFSEDDIILSATGIDVKLLIISRANALLRCALKNRKTSIILMKGKKLKWMPLLGNCFRRPRLKYASVSMIVGKDQSIDNLHMITPKSTSTTVSGKREVQRRKFCHTEQVNANKIFLDITQHKTSLKFSLSLLTRKAVECKENFLRENYTDCLKIQHSVKLCTSYLSKMNVKSIQSMNNFINAITDFIDVSLNQRSLLPSNNKTREISVRKHMRHAAPKNVMHSLVEIFPKMFAGKSERPNTFQALEKKLLSPDASCNTCEKETDPASLATQKLLLLISLNDPHAEFNVLMNQLVYCLLGTESCLFNTDSSDSSVNGDNSGIESENASHPPELPSGHGASSSQSERSLQQNTIETELNATGHSLETNLKVSKLHASLNQKSPYFKLTEILSSSGSDNSLENELSNVGMFNEGFSLSEDVTLQGSDSAHLETICSVESLTSTKNKKYKNINKNKALLHTSANIWRSVDKFLKPKKSYVQSVAQHDSLKNSNSCESQIAREVISECSFINPVQRPSLLDAGHHSRGNDRNCLHLNHEATQSSFKGPTENEKPKGNPKTHVETVEMKMDKDGDGFGFVLRFSFSNFSDTLPVPIITVIKPKTPAYKVGILAKRDRILAIDGQSFVEMPLRDLEKLKRRVFEADFVNLTVEFDVKDIEMKFGTFDVVLDKSLNVGLIFEDLQEDSPMVVSSVVKGSAAHRSGQLFPGDKVIFIKSMRNEEFDPLSGFYNREENVTITVQRDLIEDIKERSIQSLPANTNPSNFDPGSSNQAGINFIIRRRKAIRTVEGIDVMFLDHEVTLFRDPKHRNFGFLVGENPETRRAYITDLRPGGPASASGVIKKLDRIVKVNGVSVGQTEDSSALSLLAQATDVVVLLIRRRCHEEQETTDAPPESS